MGPSSGSSLGCPIMNKVDYQPIIIFREVFLHLSENWMSNDYYQEDSTGIWTLSNRLGENQLLSVPGPFMKHVKSVFSSLFLPYQCYLLFTHLNSNVVLNHKQT